MLKVTSGTNTCANCTPAVNIERPYERLAKAYLLGKTDELPIMKLRRLREHYLPEFDAQRVEPLNIDESEDEPE